jgi:hypothetical protein
MSTDLPEPTDISVFHPLIIAALYYYAFRSVWLKKSSHERVVGLFTGAMAAALYATGTAFMLEVEDETKTIGVKTDMIKPISKSFLTLGGCVILPFFNNFNARVAAILTNTLIAQILQISSQLGWHMFYQIRSLVVISKLAMLLLGILGVRGLVKLGKLANPVTEYFLCVAVVIFPGMLELIITPSAASLYGLSMIAVLVSGVLSSWFLNKDELLILMVSNILGIGCLFAATRVLIVYSAVAGLCYLSYKHNQKRFQYLSVSAMSLGLLAISLMSTQSLNTDKKWQPYAVLGFFMLLASIIVRLVAKRRFPALLSGFVFFPLLYIIASFLDRTQLAMRQEEMELFKNMSMLHFLSLVPLALGGPVRRLRGEYSWKVSYLLLSHTALFQLGYEAGHMWFKEKIWRIETVFRLTALLASLAGFFRTSWETRFYSLLVCIVLSEFFLSPFSAAFLCTVFWAVRVVPPTVRRVVLFTRSFADSRRVSSKPTSIESSSSSTGATSLDSAPLPTQ